jgi:hypothetical protein
VLDKRDILLFAIFVPGIFLCWKISIKGLKEKKIMAVYKGMALKELKGKAAFWYSLFWLAVAMALTACLIKYAFLVFL